MEPSTVWPRVELMKKFGWALGDVLDGEHDVFTVAGSFIAERFSWDYTNGGLSHLTAAQELAAGDALRDTKAAAKDMTSVGVPYGETVRESDVQAGADAVWAVRGRDDVGPTDTNRAVLMVQYSLDSNIEEYNAGDRCSRWSRSSAPLTAGRSPRETTARTARAATDPGGAWHGCRLACRESARWS
ncbi:hypothetical protein IC607_11165 [Cellulomonas sp. JH27-2]|uniref:hypothetical protein n=1 Tax=Cellulomonas sp. JH27-2 TaxID=2774139 RepID=UPI00177C891B|nr:hypothetical protein [Cellulomonas sp. JH27-2]MBD8059525.1 hypothetical protein [Cellulomonas sp. JH27-2]